MLPFCVELVAVADPILVHAGSPCGQQLAAWEARAEWSSPRVDPMRLIVAWRRSGFSMDPYSYLFMLACDKRDKEFYSRRLL